MKREEYKERWRRREKKDKNIICEEYKTLERKKERERERERESLVGSNDEKVCLETLEMELE